MGRPRSRGRQRTTESCRTRRRNTLLPVPRRPRPWKLPLAETPHRLSRALAWIEGTARSGALSETRRAAGVPRRARAHSSDQKLTRAVRSATRSRRDSARDRTRSDPERGRRSRHRTRTRIHGQARCTSSRGARPAPTGADVGALVPELIVDRLEPIDLDEPSQNCSSRSIALSIALWRCPASAVAFGRPVNWWRSCSLRTACSISRRRSSMVLSISSRVVMAPGTPSAPLDRARTPAPHGSTARNPLV